VTIFLCCLILFFLCDMLEGRNEKVLVKRTEISQHVDKVLNSLDNNNSSSHYIVSCAQFFHVYHNDKMRVKLICFVQLVEWDKREENFLFSFLSTFELKSDETF
jgi:hypothetical protein